MISQPRSLGVPADTILVEIFGPIGNPPAIGVRRNRTINPAESDTLYSFEVRGNGTVVLEGSNVVNIIGVDNTPNGGFSKEPRSSHDVSDWTTIATQANTGTSSGSIAAPTDYAFLRLRVTVPGDGEIINAYVSWD